jgi:hypothetical protein
MNSLAPSHTLLELDNQTQDPSAMPRSIDKAVSTLKPEAPQAAFARALLDPDLSCPPDVTTWNGSDPLARLAVYRNNVVVSLIDALVTTFDVTQALVGQDFFRAMAREFVRRSPPTHRVLTYYGDAFAGFIEQFEPAQSVPYLADMARLEYARVRAYHSADQALITQEHLAPLLQDPSALMHTRFKLGSGLALLRSDWAVVALWAAHQDPATLDAQLSGLDVQQADHLVVFREDWTVKVQRMEPAPWAFVQGMAEGLNLADASARAFAIDPTVNLPEVLGWCLQKGQLVGVAP